MLAPVTELHEYTGCTQAAAVVRRLQALGAPATHETLPPTPQRARRQRLAVH